MPELPEVETVVRTLEYLIHGRQIKEINIIFNKVVENNTEYFIQRLKNQHFNQFSRRGKYLIFTITLF